MSVRRLVYFEVAFVVALGSLSLGGTSMAGEPQGSRTPEVVVTAARCSAELEPIVDDWWVSCSLPEGIDWAPMPVKWTKLDVGVEGPGVTHSLDGRRVGVMFPGHAIAKLPNGLVVRQLGRDTRLLFDSDEQELCAGPIEVSMLGLNVEGEETVLRMAGEVTDARWRRRHCKAKG
jgi:hypothetical protein